MNYAEFFHEDEVQVFRRVKRGTQRLGDLGRGAVVEILSREGVFVERGHDESNKDFIHTMRGWFRLAPAVNSDNSTETAAHGRMGVTTVVMDDDSMVEFFNTHGLDGEHQLIQWRHAVKKRL